MRPGRQDFVDLTLLSDDDENVGFNDSAYATKIPSSSSAAVTTTVTSDDDDDASVVILDSTPIPNGVTSSSRSNATNESPRKRRRSTELVTDVRPKAKVKLAHQHEEDLPCTAPEERWAGKEATCTVLQPDLVYPKSQYERHRPSLPVERERHVLKDFLKEEIDAEMTGDDFLSYQLEDFSVYNPKGHRLSLEMAPLSQLTQRGGNVVLVDGILSNGKSRRYVEGMPIKTPSIGNYGDPTTHAVGKSIWIQSMTFSKVWYELGTPAPEYERYHKPFLWLADFGKHFFDYIEAVAADRDVVLADFKSDFSSWLKRYHSQSHEFSQWYAEYGRDDFRQAVAAHRDWLWNQTHGLVGGEGPLATLTVWNEILHLTAITPAPGKWEERTVVTPYVYDCFEGLFGDKMKKVIPAPERTGPPTIFAGVHVPAPIRAARDERGEIIPDPTVNPQVGDVVAIYRDIDTKWKSKSQFSYWYGYVIDRLENRGKPYLHIIWLYAVEDTILSMESYPHHNELFFSNHCNCDSDSKLYVSDVLCTVSVAFFKGPRETGCEFFMRQKYRDEDPAFMTLQKSDLVGCSCINDWKSPWEEVIEKFRIGDTVLINTKEGPLEPREICEFSDDGDQKTVQVRELLRRHRMPRGQSARPNELVYTQNASAIRPEDVVRRCHIKIVKDVNNIPAPYDRDGTGDCFFITSELHMNGSIVPFSFLPGSETFRQGVDFSGELPQRSPLQGLDLFCGGGNFGRGIEEGGAVSMKWAVDIATAALHSYRANLHDVDNTQLYLGSINNYLQDAIKGKHGGVIASPGEVDFISAGSPCQGFSTANSNKHSEESIRNCSLVASVATAVDIYRPKYALLENVAGLATSRKMGEGRTVNVLAQLLCCIVGMGYQCQQWTLDSWSYGSPQSRTRLFVSIAAPGQKLPSRPPRSHEHPPYVKDRALYKAPNGAQFGSREIGPPCPFPFVPVKEGFKGLPRIGDNHVGICIPFPDHRASRIEAARTRTLIAHIPRVPEQQGWRQAKDAGRLPPAMAEMYDDVKQASKRWKQCRSWMRVAEKKLCPTITTCCTPADSYTGMCLHYDEHRLLTIQEARRAQSFPDHEVLVGEPSKAWKVVGNSVARSVSLAWGLSIREAYLGDDVSGKPSGMEDSSSIWNPSNRQLSSGKPSEQPSSAGNDFGNNAAQSLCDVL